MDFNFKDDKSKELFKNREIAEEKVEEPCEEVIKEKSEKITVADLKSLYEQNSRKNDVDQEEIKKLEINNRFLESVESVLVIKGRKQLNKKDTQKKDVKDRDGKKVKVYVEYFQNIYMQLLPKDLQGIEIDNLALKINRFPLMELKNNDEVKFHFQDSYCVEYDQNKIDDYYSAIKKLPLNFSTLPDFKTSYRLVIGGEATVYETSMRLHHIYGIPYIPASGIKGVVRSYIITEKFGSSEEDALKEDDFVKVFGSQDHAGEVTFFDAFPTAKPMLKVDIMNPHYGEYYGDKKNKVAPTDTQSPKPINFLTVENTTFRFMMGAKEKLETFSIKDKNNNHKTIETWLTEAFKNHGLGAKTAVGYGYLE
jgi:CRISPR-associated protein Cmr6